MKIARWVLCLCLSLPGLACTKHVSDRNAILTSEDLLVKNNEITGWSYSGTRWLASGISELTIYIDGMAEIYRRHGFREAAHQAYQGRIGGANRQIDLTVYEMGTQGNARAAYEDPDLGLSGAVVWTNGAGAAARYVRYGGFSQVLAFYRDAYFVYLEINHDSEEGLNVLKQFALNVDGSIE